MDRDSKKAGGALPAPAEVPANTMGNAVAQTPLAPGVRFHPSDEEIISYYLKRKVQDKTMRFDTIEEVDIYEHEPEDLAEHSKLKTRDQEWFFISAVDKKYKSGTSVQRATKQGHWRATGKDREIRQGDGGVTIGMMKILVFYAGRPPHGRRTNWVMHEYRLAENNQGLSVDAYVLCRVFLKQNTGANSGNSGSIYAPFLEEEWKDDAKGAVSPVPAVIQQLLREGEIDDKNKKVDDEALKRESATPLPHFDDLDKEAPLPLCVLNKEAPLPLAQNKRKRQINPTGNSNSSITQDLCSSTETIIDTGAAEPLENLERLTTSVLESCFTNMLGNLLKEQEQVTKMVHASSLTDLLEENQKMVEFRETQVREMMKSKMLVNFLEETIKALREENEQLKKNNSNKEQ